MTRTDWKININNPAESATYKYGTRAVEGVFQRYGATCFEDLSSAYYNEVFGDLMQMDEDD